MVIRKITVYKRKDGNCPYLLKLVAENGLVGYSEIYNIDDLYYLNKILDKVIGRSIYNTDSMVMDFDCQLIGPLSSAIGSIEIAMWDVLGKKAQQPIYNLLGGKINQPIFLCAVGWDLQAYSPLLYASEAEKMVSKGYTTIKFNPLKVLSSESIKHSRIDMWPVVKVVEAIRNAVGPEVQLCIELNNQLDMDQSLRLLRDVEHCDIYYAANPTRLSDIGGLKKLSMRGNIPMQVGKHAASLREMQILLECGYISTLEYDAIQIGGIGEARYLAAINEANYIKVSTPYLSQTGFAANIHVAAATPVMNRMDINVHAIERDKGIWVLGHEINNGMICLNDKAPGLGVIPNKEYFEEVMP